MAPASLAHRRIEACRAAPKGHGRTERLGRWSIGELPRSTGLGRFEQCAFESGDPYASAQATYRFPTRRAEPQLQIGAQPSIGSKLSMSRLRVVGRR
ncbi:hypothetical protein, partial [Aquimonas sp.]|uniref:hypothetical protein n=1 Tax=Aquimonas sp. TaxID=1872588 RepID=UPI0037C134D2